MIHFIGYHILCHGLRSGLWAALRPTLQGSTISVCRPRPEARSDMVTLRKASTGGEYKIATRAPKRRIERVKSIIVDGSVDNATETVVLHTAEDTKTLVRALGQFLISPIDTAMTAVNGFQLMLKIRPAGVSITNPATTQALDTPVPLQEIASWWAEGIMNNANGQITTGKIEFDTKAMRKLKQNDEVVVSYLATVASDFRLRGIVYLWFKE